jgi:signal transduction histidine kinase
MLMTKVQFGLSYAILGALLVCGAFPVLGMVSMSSVLPILIYLVLAGVGVGILNQLKRGRFGRPNFLVNRKEDLDARLPIVSENPNHQSLLGHEIKNYLCTLKGNARLLRQRVGSQEHDPILDRIDRVVAKLEVFAKDLGNLPESGISGQELSGKKKATFKVLLSNPKALIRSPVKIGEVARACVSTHFHNQSVNFLWNFLDDGAGLLGDANRLEQVFLNLFVNAKE